MFENERWTLRAQHLLQQAEKSAFVSATHIQSNPSSRLKLLSCCGQIRAQRILLGTHRNASITPFPMELPSLTAADLEEDLRFPWFLEVTAKRKLVQVFLATVNLHRSIDPICPLVLRREPDPLFEQKGVGGFVPFRGSVMGALEDVESSLVEWKAQYIEIFQESWLTGQKQGTESAPCLAVAAAYLNLTYEYVIFVVFIKRS